MMNDFVRKKNEEFEIERAKEKNAHFMRKYTYA